MFDGMDGPAVSQGSAVIKTEAPERMPALPGIDDGGYLAATLDLLSDPIIVLDAYRSLLFANNAAARVLATRAAGFGIQGGVLMLPDREADEHLALLVARMSLQPAGRVKGGRFIVRRPSGSKHWFAAITRLAPLHDDQHAEHAVFLLHLVGRLRPRHLSATALRNLFGLTAAEIAVARRVVLHETTPQIAKHLCRSSETIKAALRQIFLKCDVKSRADLIALLQRISLFDQDGDAKYP
jgi:DNA-binding CsgD family transcriptional regulator